MKWDTGGTCVVEGCTNPVRIELEHVKDWAHTKTTQLRDLAAPCAHCHALKTYKGHTFGPRLPTGKRRLYPPDEQPPHQQAPGEPAAHESRSAHRPGRARDDEVAPPPNPSGPPRPTELFDTG